MFYLFDFSQRQNLRLDVTVSLKNLKSIITCQIMLKIVLATLECLYLDASSL